MEVAQSGAVACSNEERDLLERSTQKTKASGQMHPIQWIEVAIKRRRSVDMEKEGNSSSRGPNKPLSFKDILIEEKENRCQEMEIRHKMMKSVRRKKNQIAHPYG